MLSHSKETPSWFRHNTQPSSLPQLAKPLKILFRDALQCYLRFSFVFISLNLHSLNQVSSIFEKHNKPWRLGWRRTQATYHHNPFLVRHWKKPWTHVARCIVIMQQPVLCMPLVRHFLPRVSIKTLSTPQNCWFTDWHWRKRLLLKNCLTVQENRQHALEVWLHVPQLSLMAGGWLFHWDDCRFVPRSKP